MAKERIEVEGGKTYGPYSSGVKSYGVIWLAGQIAPEAGEDIASQTAASLEKIDALLAAAGVSKNEACFAQVLLDDINDFAAMNEVYSAWLEGVECGGARVARCVVGHAADAVVVHGARLEAGELQDVVGHQCFAPNPLAKRRRGAVLDHRGGGMERAPRDLRAGGSGG